MRYQTKGDDRVSFRQIMYYDGKMLERCGRPPACDSSIIHHHRVVEVLVGLPASNEIVHNHHQVGRGIKAVPMSGIFGI